MMTFNISGKEYKVKFGFNSFADSDLLDRVQDMAELFNGEEEKGFGALRDLFSTVRELLYVGFRKHNPEITSVEEVGDLLDTYIEETPKDAEGNPLEERGILALFIQLTEELSAEGFLADFVGKMMAAESENTVKMPQDHKKATKKK